MKEKKEIEEKVEDEIELETDLSKSDLLKIIIFQHNLLEDIDAHGLTWLRNYESYRSAVEKSVAQRTKAGISVSYDDSGCKKSRKIDLSKLKVPVKKIDKKSK